MLFFLHFERISVLHCLIVPRLVKIISSDPVFDFIFLDTNDSVRLFRQGFSLLIDLLILTDIDCHIAYSLIYLNNDN